MLRIEPLRHPLRRANAKKPPLVLFNSPLTQNLRQGHFVPVLDVIHVLGYLYPAALAVHREPTEVWACYRRLATACWQGRTLEVIAALEAWLEEQGLVNAELEDSDPRQAVIDAARYLTNNLLRMNYPDYRRAGLTVTSALMESLVKEINYRAKGTEMFWNNPTGAEAILQIRAAALSEDDRLSVPRHPPRLLLHPHHPPRNRRLTPTITDVDPGGSNCMAEQAKISVRRTIRQRIGTGTAP